MDIKTTVSAEFDEGFLVITFDTSDNTVSIESGQETDCPNMLRIKKPLLGHLKYMIEQLEARVEGD